MSDGPTAPRGKKQNHQQSSSSFLFKSLITCVEVFCFYTHSYNQFFYLFKKINQFSFWGDIFLFLLLLFLFPYLMFFTVLFSPGYSLMRKMNNFLSFCLLFFFKNFFLCWEDFLASSFPKRWNAQFFGGGWHYRGKTRLAKWYAPYNVSFRYLFYSYWRLYRFHLFDPLFISLFPCRLSSLHYPRFVFCSYLAFFVVLLLLSSWNCYAIWKNAKELTKIHKYT